MIDAAEKASPKSAEPLVIRAEFYSAQGKFAEAWDELARAKITVSEKLAVWNAQAGLLGIQKRFDEAQTLLDQAKDLLGDRVELRLQRAKLSVMKGGPQVVKDLNELAQNIERVFQRGSTQIIEWFGDRASATAGSARCHSPMVATGGTGAQRS